MEIPGPPCRTLIKATQNHRPQIQVTNELNKSKGRQDLFQRWERKSQQLPIVQSLVNPLCNIIVHEKNALSQKNNNKGMRKEGKSLITSTTEERKTLLG